MIKFTEEKLEQAVIELFEIEGYKHLTGDRIHKEMSGVLLRDDLKQYLLNRYAAEDITLNEITSIIRKLEFYPASAFYETDHGYPPVPRDEVFKEIFEQAENFKKYRDE